MRKIFDYIRSLFCQHDYEEIGHTLVYDGTFAPYYKPIIGTKWIHRCKKCGYLKITKNY